MWGPNMACGHALRGKILNALSLGWCALFLWGLLSLLKFGRGHQPLLQELEVGRAVSFIHEADLETDHNKVTIAVQFTVDRLATFLELVKIWRAPVSAVVFIRTQQDLNTLFEQFNDGSPWFPLLSRFVDLHLFRGQGSEPYPINKLRNIALKNVRTHFVLSLDVDFIPCRDMHQLLSKTLNLLASNRVAIVVPAFELNESGVAITYYPETKYELVDLYYQGKVQQVHLTKGVNAHVATDYSKWIRAKEAYRVKYRYLYEPYVLIRKDQSPRYDERFAGYGNDKAAYTYELVAAGFELFVHPQAFVIHKDHAVAEWQSDQGSSVSWRRWSQFIRDIDSKYKYQEPIPDWLKEDCKRGDCPEFWKW